MDVNVVGAGPAGCAAGARAAGLGARVKIYEEHGKIGEPVACSAIVSRKGLDACGVPYESVSFNRLRGAFIHLPDGLVLHVKADHDVANVFDRAKYDRLCAKRAEKAGAEIITGKKCGARELKKLGFKVRGLNGLKALWRVDSGRAVSKFKSRKIFTFLVDITELFVYHYPSLAFQFFN